MDYKNEQIGSKGRWSRDPWRIFKRIFALVRAKSNLNHAISVNGYEQDQSLETGTN